METFGDWLRQQREDRGISQAELARRAEMARATVSLYEKNAINQPRLHQLEKIANVLGIEKDEMRSAFASLAMQVASGGADMDSFEVAQGVIVSFDKRKAKLSTAQRSEVVYVLKLLIKGIGVS